MTAGTIYPRPRPKVNPEVPSAVARAIWLDGNIKFANRPAYGSAIARGICEIICPVKSNGKRFLETPKGIEAKVFRMEPIATNTELEITTLRTETKSERKAHGKRTIDKSINEI